MLWMHFPIIFYIPYCISCTAMWCGCLSTSLFGSEKLYLTINGAFWSHYSIWKRMDQNTAEKGWCARLLNKFCMNVGSGPVCWKRTKLNFPHIESIDESRCIKIPYENPNIFRHLSKKKKKIISLGNGQTCEGGDSSQKVINLPIKGVSSKNKEMLLIPFKKNLEN